METNERIITKLLICNFSNQCEICFAEAQDLDRHIVSAHLMRQDTIMRQFLMSKNESHVQCKKKCVDYATNSYQLGHAGTMEDLQVRQCHVRQVLIDEGFIMVLGNWQTKLRRVWY